MRRWLLAVVMCGMGAAPVWAADPFSVAFSQAGQGTNLRISVAVAVPPGYHIYAGQARAELDDGTALALVGGDPPVDVRDGFTGADIPAYTNDVVLVYSAGPTLPPSHGVKFSYQGCSEKECFFPQTRTYVVQAPGVPPLSGATSRAESGARVREGWSGTFRSHKIVAQAVGYLNVSGFQAFLDRAEGVGGGGFSGFGADPMGFLKAKGMWWTMLVILVGGLLLNLTPCVLPMIPINLAILGVGSHLQQKEIR